MLALTFTAGKGKSSASQGYPACVPVDRPPSLQDVAVLAGVSHQTVSRVVNDSPSVRPETRARVVAAMQELSYRPNVAARALASRRSRTIGVLAMESPLFGPATTLYAVERAARQAGLFVTVASVEDPTTAALEAALERLTGQGVDGVVAIAPLVGAAAALMARAADVLPLVVIGGSGPAGARGVRVDQAGGAALVTEHLLAQGASTVLHLAGPHDWADARGRERGWRRALAARGVPAPALLRGDWSAASGYALGQELARRRDVEAVFAGNDQMAVGVLRALRQHGVDVPGDVLVAGFDDIPEAAFLTPSLTTARQDLLTSGQRAVEMLLGDIGGGASSPGSVLVPTELVIRESSVRPTLPA